MEAYPERRELVLATVERVTDHGAFVKLDEYGDKQGIVSLREFSAKWVKNPRDYLKEGQKSVLRVIRVNTERGHIDLSLKEVSENEKRNKLKDFKLEIRVGKLMEHMAAKMGKKPGELHKMFGDKLVEDYGSLYEAFAAVANGRDDLKGYIKDEKLRLAVIQAISETIKPTLVSIRGFVTLHSEAGDGIEAIKSALTAGQKTFPEGIKGEITYVKAPNYRIDVTADDYKKAEKALKDCYETVEKQLGSKASFEFSRELKKVE